MGLTPLDFRAARALEVARDLQSEHRDYDPDLDGYLWDID